MEGVGQFHPVPVVHVASLGWQIVPVLLVKLETMDKQVKVLMDIMEQVEMEQQDKVVVMVEVIQQVLVPVVVEQVQVQIQE